MLAAHRFNSGDREMPVDAVKSNVFGVSLSLGMADGDQETSRRREPRPQARSSSESIQSEQCKVAHGRTPAGN